MLQINNLTKKYPNGKLAVSDLSLTALPGDILGFIGQNGAGKTTTIRAVTGVLAFDGGDIFIGGKNIKTDPIACKQITAYIPDDPSIYVHMTGTKYINFVADIYGVPQKERCELIETYAKKLDMLDDLNGLIFSYSHGMRQKLSIIAALTHSPKLLVLDEPFVGLDPKSSHTLRETMRELCAQGMTVFFSSHVLETVEKLCNKIAIIKDGRLIANGGTDEIRGNQSLEQVFLELTDDEK